MLNHLKSSIVPAFAFLLAVLPAFAHAAAPEFDWADVTATLALIATQIVAFGPVLVVAVAAIAVVKYIMAVIV